MMGNPRILAAVSVVVIVLALLRIFGGGEASSPLLAFLDWVILALGVVGLIGAIRKLTQGP